MIKAAVLQKTTLNFAAADVVQIGFRKWECILQEPLMIAECSKVLVTGLSLPPLKPVAIKLLLTSVTVELDFWKLHPQFKM